MTSSGTGNQVARAAIEALEQRIRQEIPHRQRGRFRRKLSRLIHRAPSYFEQLRRKGRRGGHVTLADWIELCLAVHMDPVDTLANILRPPGDNDILPLRPSGEPSPAVQRARQRFQRADEGEQKEPISPEHLALLAELDQERYDHPESAIKRAEAAVDRVPVVLLPRLLGVLGSSYRMVLSSVNDAEHAVRAGLDLISTDEFLTRGDLLQRLAYITGERGDFHTSLHLARLAMTVHADGGNLHRIGQCLVDTGVFRFHLEDYEGAIQAQKSALQWIAEDDLVHRCAALQGLGLYHHRLQEPELARDYAEQADELSGTLGESAQVRLTWLKASIVNDLKDFRAAEDLYRSVLQYFQARQAPNELALVTLDLILMTLRLNRRGEARKLAASFFPLVMRSPDRTIQRVIANLVRHGNQGITLERVSSARNELRRRQNRPRPG